MIDAGYRVLFTRTSELVQKLQAARQSLQLPSALAKLDRFDLICVHTKLDSDFAASWTGISREGGHGFHGKLDSDFTRSWTVTL